MTDHRLQCFDQGDKVIAVIDGVATEFPWELADIFSRSLTINARKCEEYCKANQIIADNALMQRAGFPVGLSDNPIIKDETVKEALFGKNLRRLLPFWRKDVAIGIESIKSRGSVGVPTLTKRPAL